MKKYKIVEVEWLDAQSGLGQAQYVDELCIEILDLNKTYFTKSTGYLLYEDKKRIILGFMLFGDNMVKHYQVIPKCLIKKRSLKK